MAWLILIGAGAMEIVWAIALKQSAGWTRLWPGMLAAGAALASFLLLAAALRTLPVGTAYPVWVGIGTLGVALVGILALNESASPPRLLCLALILAGVIGLKLLDP